MGVVSKEIYKYPRNTDRARSLWDPGSTTSKAGASPEPGDQAVKIALEINPRRSLLRERVHVLPDTAGILDMLGV